VLIATIVICSYPAAYAVVRALGLIVHYSIQGPDGHQHHTIGYSWRPVDRAFRPMVRLEARLRHFEAP
jgi:hypothetical protein